MKNKIMQITRITVFILVIVSILMIYLIHNLSDMREEDTPGMGEEIAWLSPLYNTNNHTKRCYQLHEDIPVEEYEKKCITVDYQYSPNNILYFHTYWNQGWNPVLTWLIQSFLLSQDLSYSRLIIWSKQKLTPPPSISAILDTKYVQNMIFDMEELSKGTCFYRNKRLFGYVHWYGIVQFSDAARLLMLKRYGGVWIDSDSILLRSLEPLIRVAHEFATHYQLDSNQFCGSDHWNNHIIHANKYSGTADKMINAGCKILAEGAREECLPAFKEWKLNDALLRCCDRVYNCGLSSVSRYFTDPNHLNGVVACSTTVDIPDLFYQSYILHHRGNDCIELPTNNAFRKILAKLDKAFIERRNNMIEPFQWLTQ